MYEYEELLKEKFEVIKQFIENRGYTCEIDLIRDYLLQIKVNTKMKFKIYYKAKKDSFSVQFIKGFEENEILKKDIEEFIDNGFLNKISRENKEEVNTKIKEKYLKGLSDMYQKIYKYKDCNIEYTPLIKELFNVCTEEEKIEIENNKYDFNYLESIVRRYI